MPDMTGYELAQEIRRRFAENDICLVAVTGYGQESNKKLARDAGFNTHVVKPISKSDLERLLGSLAGSPLNKSLLHFFVDKNIMMPSHTAGGTDDGIG